MSSRNFDEAEVIRCRGTRSHSAQGLAPTVSSPAMKIPLPPRMWITDIEDESSDEANLSVNDDGVMHERPRVRSRFRHHKAKPSSVPIGIFWDIENCQVPRGVSAIHIVAAIRAKFLPGRREADFVVVCDVRKEVAYRLKELNDAQVNLIHVCGTQKNAADEKLRQCMRRFGELHTAPAALLLISGDINFAADLSDFRYRKNMEVILVHKQNTSSALIQCATSHYSYTQLTEALPLRKPKSESQSNDDDEDPACEIDVVNLPYYQSYAKVRDRLRRLADNCGGRVLRIVSNRATLRFPTPDHANRAMKRMDGEDCFGRKIVTRCPRGIQPTYSSDEGYSTAPPAPPAPPATHTTHTQPTHQAREPAPACPPLESSAASEWALALQQLPACPPAALPRQIRGTHGSVNVDRSGWSSSNSGDDSRLRAGSPWNSSASLSEHSEGEDTCELTVGNLPPFEPALLQSMLTQLFSQHVSVLRVAVRAAPDGPQASLVLRSEGDARLAIARLHKRRLDHQWTGRRLELALGRPSPAPPAEVLRARLRAILLEQRGFSLPLLRLRDAYASRHCCALTTSDIARVQDTVVIHEGFGRMVQLVDMKPVSSSEMEEAPWKCHIHASLSLGPEDGSRILQPVFMEVAVLAQNTHILLENHGGILPLLSFVECYEATFSPLVPDTQHGVPLELLLRSEPSLEVRDTPSRHLTWRTESQDSSHSVCSQSSDSRGRGRTAPALEPMLALFERELLDLLRTAPRCTIPFSKLIPAFHHHFGRQCRVADYGFTKLPDLLAALDHSIVVLGSGSSRVITISSGMQARRWTSDLVKLLKIQPTRALTPREIPDLYQMVFGREFSPTAYGVCSLAELMARLCPRTVALGGDGAVSLPRRPPTPEERARTAHFAMQTVELLCYTPNLRMELSRFVPSYHSHFGRQLRVAHYGCVKLGDLLDTIPAVVGAGGGERAVRLVPAVARPVLARRLAALGRLPLSALAAEYARQFGAPPMADMLDVSTLEELVLAAGGYVESGVVLPPGGAGRWTSAVLCACAALCGDRSVRGSSREYFLAAHRRLAAAPPDLPRLVAAGAIRLEDSRVVLQPAWRAAARLAQTLAGAGGAPGAPRRPADLYLEYTQRHDPLFPDTDNGLEGMIEFLRRYREIFFEDVNGNWVLVSGVSVPPAGDRPAPREDYSALDTPPGQKGSRVFESPSPRAGCPPRAWCSPPAGCPPRAWCSPPAGCPPRAWCSPPAGCPPRAWCSPPACALPAPSALLTQEKRRTRLAAQFDASS